MWFIVFSTITLRKHFLPLHFGASFIFREYLLFVCRCIFIVLVWENKICCFLIRIKKDQIRDVVETARSETFLCLRDRDRDPKISRPFSRDRDETVARPRPNRKQKKCWNKNFFIEQSFCCTLHKLTLRANRMIAWPNVAKKQTTLTENSFYRCRSAQSWNEDRTYRDQDETS